MSKEVTLPISAIKPYWRNPRNNDNAIEIVKQSIQQFGFNSRIVVDANNVIIAGHTRYKALQQLGWTEIPCLIKDDLNVKQAKAYRIADNKSGEVAIWDMEKLMQELRELPDMDMQTYFKDLDIDRFLQSTAGQDIKPISQDFIDNMSNNLNQKFETVSQNTQEAYVEVICPHCASFFSVERNALLKEHELSQ